MDCPVTPQISQRGQPRIHGLKNGRSQPHIMFHFLNTTCTDVELYLEVSGKALRSSDAQKGPKSDDGPTPLLLRSLAPAMASDQLQTHDEILLSYYESVICSTSTFSDNKSDNPYRHVFLPMAFESVGIFDSITAISAQVMGFRSPEYRHVAVEKYNKALRYFIDLTVNQQHMSRDLDEMCALALLLCWFEVRISA